MKKILIFIITLCFVFITLFPNVSSTASPITYPNFTEEQMGSPSSISQGLQDSKIPFLMVTSPYTVNTDKGVKTGTVIFVLAGLDTSSKFTVENGILKCSTAYSKYYYTNINTVNLQNYYWRGSAGGETSDITVQNNNLYDAFIKLFNYTPSPSVGYDYYCYNPNGLELTNFGTNKLVPPVPVSEMDLKDIPVNTMRIRKPSSSAEIDTTKNLIFADDDFFTWEVDGKIGLEGNYNDNINTIKNLNEGEILAMKPIFPNCMEFTKNVSVEFLGNESDWISNGFITFKATGEVLLDKVTPVDNASLTLGCNFVNQADGFLGSSRVYTWVNDTVNFNLRLHSDVNGDGVDDNTGEVIPADSPIDSNGDGKLDEGGSTDFIQDFTKTIKNIPSYTSDITSAFSSILGFLPQPIPILIVGALATMIFVTVISFIRGN